MRRRLRSADDLERLRRVLAEKAGHGTTIRVCSTGCRALGALEVCRALEEEIAAQGLAKDVRIVRTGCHGLCAGAVAMVIDPKGIFYQGVTPDDAREIITTTVLGGEVIERLCHSSGEHTVWPQEDIPFYEHQTRLVLRNCGGIDPRSLEESISRGGYASMARVISSVEPEQVIEEITRSGLRGRGGAGFPTGRKWQLARAARTQPKYIVCNAHEGDPGAFMDRALLAGDPHLVIEGMIIGAYAIGSSKGVIYVGAEYPTAIEHSDHALAQAREAGLLGSDILGTGFDFDAEIHKDPGAFVCGEETALIASLQGQRGMPRPRPPFPAQSGYEGKPTNINNVETWANVPRIIEMGAEAYAAIGTAGSKGTKIFALAGQVKNTGLVEVPMGATLRQIVYEIGDGIPRERSFKAAQMGGPSGGCVPARYLDLPIDYDSVKDVGAIMGSGGLVIMDEATCMVDIARFFTEFVQSESCGKCVPCRVGTKRMLEILTRITLGKGELADIDRLERLGEMIKLTSLCGLGQSAPNPVLSTIRHFRDEYEAHIVEQKCPANSCDAFVSTACSSACPAHVNVPEYVGLIAAGRFTQALDVIRKRNPLPSICGRACDHPCELFCLRGDADEPVAIRHLERFACLYEKDHQPPTWVGPREGRVAIIGSGPAGLTAAYFLALMGREVKLFEATDVVGGMPALGIPPYRLPREALARDIEYIRRAGVEIETGRRIESLQELRDAGYDAIFVATGALNSAKMNIPGEDMEGVYDALSFLRNVILGETRELAGPVVVVGGGHAAIHAARTALRLGARPVTVIYPRRRDEMPALREEIEDALCEGVNLQVLIAPTAIEGDGRVCGVRCTEMELGEADESGRRRPAPKPGSEVLIEAEHVIIAIGQSPELNHVESDGQIVVSRGRVWVDPVTQRSGDGDVFAGGDMVTGPSTIVEAIAAGQRAAQAVDIMLGGKGELPPDKGFAPRGKPDVSECDTPRQPVSVPPVAERICTFREVVDGYSEEQARAEARRCFRCDLEK